MDNFRSGATSAGVGLRNGLEAVRRISKLTPSGVTMAEFALRWMIDQSGVETVVPGARRVEQARTAKAAQISPVTSQLKSEIKEIYNELISPQIGGRW
jgi:aryl-alcohol dehydrogenase-like predicted oxidoreductase